MIRRYQLPVDSTYIGQHDPVSRSLFSAGDEVVDCGNGHLYHLDTWLNRVGRACPACGAREDEATKKVDHIEAFMQPTLPAGTQPRAPKRRPALGRSLLLGGLVALALLMAAALGFLVISLVGQPASSAGRLPTLAPAAAVIEAASLPTATALPAVTAVVDLPLGPSPSPLASETPTLQPTDVIAPTAQAIVNTGNLLSSWSVPVLATRQWDGSPIQLDALIFSVAAYDQWAFSYTSENLRLTGLVNIPNGEGAPWPVAMVLHGGIDQSAYAQGSGSADHADILARNGYVAFMPDYRSYNNTPGSGSPLKLPWTIDVLDLILALPSLPQADPGRIGVLGHSRGGGIASHIMVTADVDAVVLYASLSTDEEANWYRYRDVFGVTWPDEDALEVGSPATNPEGYAMISPVNYLDRARMPVQIHHGTDDGTLPISWSRDLHERMQALGLYSELYEYPGAGHSFYGEDYTAFMYRVVTFFDEHVK